MPPYGQKQYRCLEKGCGRYFKSRTQLNRHYNQCHHENPLHVIKNFSIGFPRKWLTALDKLIEQGFAASRSEFFRLLFFNYLHDNEPVIKILSDRAPPRVSLDDIQARLYQELGVL